MNLAEQLTDIYEKKEDWHKTRLSHEEAVKYHQERLDWGNIITVSDGNTLAGYLEFYIRHGVCYIHNLFILPEYRRGIVAKMIKRRLFEVAKGCKVFFGERNKHAQRYPELQTRR
jgi:ribosomal protein S18 acetylase RimI-like enzyme